MRTVTEMLPNGLVVNGECIREVEIRQLTGEDEDLMLDKTELRKGNIIDTLLKRTIVRIGSMTDPKLITKLYDESFMLADTTFMLVRLRIWGIDSNYSFDDKCDACDKISKHVIDLNDLKVDEQPEEHRGKLEYTDEISVLGDKYTVKHRPLLVKDQATRNMINEQYPKDKATRELMIQLLEVNGAKPTVSEVKKLPTALRNAIRKAMDAKSGGIDTRLLCDCRKCGNSYSRTLPVDVKSFFFQVGDSSNMTPATPFRDSGTTPKYSENTSDGSQAKSAI